MASHRHVPPPVPDGHALAVIARAADVAATVLDDLHPRMMSGFGTARTGHKADGSPVTAVDTAVDQAIVAAVQAAFPDHGVVSEEGTTTWQGQEWTWIVDPIDGTTNYAAGVPYWANSIALAHHGNVVWGMIDTPVLGQRMQATRGHGCELDGQPVRVHSAVDLDDPTSRHTPMAVSWGTVRRMDTPTWFKARITGSYALDLALVAAGSLAAAFMRRPSVWDVAAGILCVTEAGGAVVEFDTPGCLPLRPDHDSDDDAVRTVAGPDHEWIEDAAKRLWWDLDSDDHV